MMKWFADVSTRTKLLLIFGVLITFLAIVIAVALKSMAASYTAQKTLQEVYLANAFDLLRLESNLNENRVSLMLMMSVHEQPIQETFRRQITTGSMRNDEIMRRLLERNANDAELSHRLNELDQTRRDFNKIRDEQTIPAILTGKTQKAETLVASIQTERYLQVRSAANELSSAAAEDARTAVEQSVQRITDAVVIFILIGILVLVISVGMAVVLSHSIAEPLKEITTAATSIAAGDLDMNLPVPERRDEVGLLAQAFARMVRSLQDMARATEKIADGDLTITFKPQSAKDVLGSSFSVMTENLRGLAQEIKEGTTVLHTLSAEILQVITQLMADLAGMETATTEADTIMQHTRQTLPQASQPQDLIARATAALEPIKRIVLSGAARAGQAKATAQNLEELGIRLGFVVGKLKV